MHNPPTYDLDAMQLRPDLARAALGDPSKLEGAFIWEQTPQGREFWEAQAAAPTSAGRSIIEFMLEASGHLALLNRRAA